MDERRSLKSWLHRLTDPDAEFTLDELRALRDALALRRQTMRAWAAAVSLRSAGDGPNAAPPDTDPLTQDEAVLLAVISASDRLTELQGQHAEMAGRLQGMEQRLDGVLTSYAQMVSVLAAIASHAQQMPVLNETGISGPELRW